MFEVGKEILCIRNHSEGVVKKGERYELLAIKKTKCRCGGVMLDVGKELSFSAPLYTLTCLGKNGCGHKESNVPNDGIKWLSGKLFAPIDNTLSDLTDADILEDALQQIQGGEG